MEPCVPASPRRFTLFCLFAVRTLFLFAALAIILPNAWATPASTTTTLAVTSSGFPTTSVTSGAIVTLTATVVSGSSPVNPGQVKFCDASAAHCEDSALIRTAQLTAAGVATYKFRPGPGSHKYQAVFVGTTSYAKSSSTTASLTVTGKYPTTATIATSGLIGNYALTATVVGSGSRTLSPTGNVSFLDTTNSNASLGTVPLGTATLAETFATKFASAVNCCPGAVVSGDFNGDGIPDVATLANGVTVLLGNGDGTFNVEPAISISADSIAVGDFNGDGVSDLVTADFSSSTVTVLLSNRNGTFTTKSTTSVGAGPEAVVAADFNGDGILDLATVNCGTTSCSSGAAVNSVTVLLGNGDGTFTTSKSTTVAGAGPPSCLVVGDFNGDGIPDLATCDSGVAVLLGNGDGTFTAQSTLTVADGANSLAVGDFNGDGVADLAVLGTAAVTVLLGKGDGTFTTKSTIDSPYGFSLSSVALGDFNGDGIPDLVMTQPAGDSIVLCLNEGDGIFATSSFTAGFNSGGYPPSVVAVGDFNGDGLPDLTVSFQEFSYLAVMLNQITQTATATLSHVSVSGAEIHQVEASYPGDTNYTSSSSSAVPLLAAKLSTTLTLSSSSNSFAVGTQITLTATLSPSSIGTYSTDGETITFYQGGTSLGTGTLSSGAATLSISSLPIGTDSLTASYTGDADFNANTSGALALKVTQVTTALQLSSSSTNSPSGFQLVLSATLSPPSSGSFFNDGETVTFYQGGKKIGVGTLSSGVATLNINPLAAGTYTFQASYPGDTNFVASNSPPYNVVAPTLQLSSNSGSSAFGSQVTLTATLNPYSSTGSSTDGQTITFYSRGLSIGTATLSSGTATLDTTVLPVGSNALTATYPGDANFLGALSNSVPETVRTVSGAIQTYVVTTTADDATGVAANCTGVGTPNCTLRDALAAATADGAGNITFASPLFATPQTIALSTNSLVVSSNTAITGPSAGVSVNAGSIDAYNSLFVINGGAVNVSMSNLTIGGYSAYGVHGGGIYNGGQLTVTNSLITGINADNVFPGGSVYGAGIYNAGTMTLTNSSVSGNGMYGRESGGGGGIFNVGALTLINSSVSSNDVSCGGTCPNFGGGIANVGTLILMGSTVSGNTARLNGSASGISNSGILVATNSNISNNDSDGNPQPNPFIEDDCDSGLPYYHSTGCPVNGVNGNVTGAPQPTQSAANTPEINPSSGTFVGLLTVTITDTTPGAIIFYTTNETPVWTRYTMPIKISNADTLQAIAVAAGYTESSIATRTYTIAPTVAQPLITPPTGTYTTAQSVTITDTTPSAVIYYTTDGTTPNRSSARFSGTPITVSSSQTIKALAVAPGYATSPEGVAIYNIIPPYAAAPTFTLAPGFYRSAQTVGLSDVTPGARIYYTTDHSAPTTSSTLYTGGSITINNTTQVKAIAVAPGYSNSPVAIGNFYVSAAQPVISPPTGRYSGSQAVTITSSTPGAIIYYTTDGSTPNWHSPVFNPASPISVTSSQTIKALAWAPGYTTSPEGVSILTITP